MKELVMFRGLPASGKSTEARDQLKSLYSNKSAVIVNKDSLRTMLHDDTWSKGNEKITVAVRDAIIKTVLDKGLSVIVDDTNLAPVHEERLRHLAKEGCAEFKPMDLTHVPLETCLERDKKRQKWVGEAVIRKMYNDYLRPAVEPEPVNHKLPWCVIVDIDGTIAKSKDRGPFEWKKVGQDDPRLHVMDAVNGVSLHGNDTIVFLSGRDSVCRDETERWLAAAHGVYLEPTTGPFLYMRPEGDMRKDYVVKKELYEKYILGRYNVRAVFDDRPQVIRLWRDIGLGDRLFDVGTGEDF